MQSWIQIQIQMHTITKRKANTNKKNAKRSANTNTNANAHVIMKISRCALKLTFTPCLAGLSRPAAAGLSLLSIPVLDLQKKSNLTWCARDMPKNCSWYAQDTPKTCQHMGIICSKKSHLVAELLRDSDLRQDLSPSTPRVWLELLSFTVEVENEVVLLLEL